MPDQPEKKASESGEPDRTWMGVALLVLFFTASIWFITLADDTKPMDWTEGKLTYLPSGKLLKPMMMDLDEAAGDLLWVNAMVYFADAYLANKSYEWLGHMLDVVTILNPHLYAAYEFGGVVLTKKKSQLPKTMKLLDRGMEEFPKDWKLRLYASTAQLALDSNFTKAAGYLEPITLDKEVPDHIRTMCASLLNKGGGRRVALAFLVDRYIHSQNTINREIFVDKILSLYPGSPEKNSERKETVMRILKEVLAEPMAEMMGLGLIHEYLSDTLSPQSRKLLELLYD
ncbi:MAG: uncharacterized protein JWO30_3103 [Fibrobacteres bacterium]|nr:uncharacterized protein [Fibrobacterota bacterium]